MKEEREKVGAAVSLFHYGLVGISCICILVLLVYEAQFLMSGRAQFMYKAATFLIGVYAFFYNLNFIRNHWRKARGLPVVKAEEEKKES